MSNHKSIDLASVQGTVIVASDDKFFVSLCDYPIYVPATSGALIISFSIQSCETGVSAKIDKPFLFHNVIGPCIAPY